MADYAKEHGSINQPRDCEASKLDSGSWNLRPLKKPDNSAVKTARHLVYLDRATDM